LRGFVVLAIFRDKVSGFTHMGGAVLAVVGTVFLCMTAESAGELAAYIIYGLSLILLLSTSATYHLVSEHKTKLIAAFRKADHAMIFALIAGSYTPLLVKCFADDVKFMQISLAAMWSAVAIGVTLKIFFTGKLRWLSTILYLALGWIAVGVIKPLWNVLGLWGMFWLFLGGAAYTTGAVMYALKKPKMVKNFGFHDLFHILVLVGAASHYVLILVFC